MRVNPPTNYRLKDGDLVELLEPAHVHGYFYDPILCPWGMWESHWMLKGSIGKVIVARTPSVTSVDGRTTYFANVDIEHNGMVSRVRVNHPKIRKVRK